MLKFCWSFYPLKNITVRYKMSEPSKPIDVADIRKPYNSKDQAFEISNIKDPFHLFCDWFGQVLKKDTTVEANAMCLATSTLDGKPSVRMVLVKAYTEEGFSFYTNYNSRKGIELKENPEAYLLFYWPAFQRQVRIEGMVRQLSEEASRAYFDRRPRQSQVSAYASAQSTVVAGKQALEAKRLEVEKKFENKAIEKPEDWGGYILKPKSYEFWQGQTDRFHDRILFRKPKGEEMDGKYSKMGENGWVYERLAP